MRGALRSLAVAAAACTSVASGHVRLLVRNTNWYYTRHHCFIGLPDNEASGGTGMGRGATELRVGGGDVTFAHEDAFGIWPPIAYQCPTRLPGGPEVALDLTFGWVYVPDGLVWAQPGCTEFAQTFIAEGPELVSVRCLVASPAKPIDVSLHKGGPDGPQIGSTRQFSAGTSMWGLVFWEPGEALTTPGNQYSIVLRPADGEPWNPFLHSKGSCYDRGHAYFDGVPYPQTDLCLLISNPGDGYIRHKPISNDARNPEEWSDVPSGQRFIARGANLIFASVEVYSGPLEQEGVYLVVRCDGPEGEQVGHRMALSHMGAREWSVKHRGIPFGPDSVPLEPGKTYFAGLEYPDGTRPVDWKARMRLYGEEIRGSHPTIATVWTGRIFRNSIEVVWRKGNPSKAILEYGKPGGPVLGTAEEFEEEGRAVLSGLEPDSLYQFRLTATSPQGFKYYSPWYLVRTRADDGSLGPVNPVQRFGKFDPHFLPVAFAPLKDPKAPYVAPEGKPVELVNPGFESGMSSWKATDGVDPEGSTSKEDVTLKAHRGEHVGGWLRVPLGAKRDMDLYAVDTLTQTVKVTPGKWYRLTAWAFTSEEEWPPERWHEETWSFPLHSSRGRDRVRLVADPKGGEELEGVNSTQWFSTDNEWMLLFKDFQAQADEVTIGAAFAQWGERDQDAAFADNFELIQLAEAPY